jgi:SAM-dependent methyltransferase
MDENISQYVRKIGMREGKIFTLRDCELCRSDAIDIISSSVIIRDAIRAPIRIAACSTCGLIFQLDRFDETFYYTYYAERYRTVISNSADPSDQFLQDQIARGRFLYQSLRPYLPASGSVLDVGCSAGGLLLAFVEQGWTGSGIDPDHRAICMGKERFKLDLTACAAETMCIADETLDLIMITGSLEHVADLHLVLEKCISALSIGGILLIEGWAYAQARILGGFGHNQKRYFSQQSLTSLFTLYGLQQELCTSMPLSGPTRPNSIFALARKTGVPNKCREHDACLSANAFDMQHLRRVLREYGIS